MYMMMCYTMIDGMCSIIDNQCVCIYKNIKTVFVMFITKTKINKKQKNKKIKIKKRI